MTEQANTRNLRKEILGLLFLAVAIFAALSLVSFSPDDPSFNNPDPFGNTRNLLGSAGSHLAGFLFSLIGLSAFWVPVFLIVVSLRSFAGLSLPSSTSCLGMLLLALTCSGLLAMGPKEMGFAGVSFPTGSIVGTVLSRGMASQLGEVGTYLVLITLALVGVLLSTRISLVDLSVRFLAFLSWMRNLITTFAVKHRERVKKKKQLKEQAEQLPKRKPRVREVEPEPVVQEEEAAPKQKAFDFMAKAGSARIPSIDLLEDPPTRETRVHRESLEMNSKILEKKLLDFGVQGHVSEVVPGPVITMYEFEPAPGVKISKVSGLSNDLAMALRASSIRIVAPIPGKAAIGIEIPNTKREMVCLKEILKSEAFADASAKGLSIALGKDIVGFSMVADLTRMPHLLIAGATGTGKSVFLNATILSLLYQYPPDRLRFLMVDPKRIELSAYKDIPHLLHPVVTDAKKATLALKWAVREMERRYRLLSELNTRNLEGYNRKLAKEGPPKETEEEHAPLPFAVIVIDELADLMMVASKDVEESITRLAQMARAAGIHLILATQRPSVDVLTGVIKANFPARISFQVSSRTDSRTILDANGAEDLLGAGDLLYMAPGSSKLQRVHGAYVSEAEVGRVTDFLRGLSEPEYVADIQQVTEGSDEEESEEAEDDRYEDAIRIVLETRQASISMLQRRLRVGYNRAARMIELMEKQGIVGPSDGVKPRQVIGMP